MDFKEAHLRTITLLSYQLHSYHDRRNLLHPHSLIPHSQSSIEKGRGLTQFFLELPHLLNPVAVPQNTILAVSPFPILEHPCRVNFKSKTKITDIQEIPVSPHLFSKLSLQIYTHFKSQSTCPPLPVFPKQD